MFKAIVVAVALWVGAGTALAAGKPAPGGEVLRALFVDLEFEPAPEECGRAIEQAMNEAGAGVRVRFDSVHYADLTVPMLASGRYRFLVLSPQGTPWSRYERERAGPLARAKGLVKQAIAHDVPVLGICGGHQFLALAYGGKTDMLDRRFRGQALMEYPADALGEFGDVEVTPVAEDPFFEGAVGADGRFLATELHREEVTEITEPLLHLARSRTVRNQVMRVRGKVAYGVQFHPERAPPEGAGSKLLANFLRMAVRARARVEDP